MERGGESQRSSSLSTPPLSSLAELHPILQNATFSKVISSLIAGLGDGLPAYCKDDIWPKARTENTFQKLQHALQSVCKSGTLAVEHDHKSVDKFDVIFKDLDQLFHIGFILLQVVSKAWSVDDGDRVTVPSPDTFLGTGDGGLVTGIHPGLTSAHVL